jgi:hypothetical protein
MALECDTDSECHDERNPGFGHHEFLLKIGGSMPREGATIFRDLVGKLEVLNIECDKCGRCAIAGVSFKIALMARLLMAGAMALWGGCTDR